MHTVKLPLCAQENSQSPHRCQSSYFQRVGPFSLAEITKMSSTAVGAGNQIQALM